ncbi:MAG TPA: glycosyltransferase family protein [Polyangiales bacterium]|nr:glycosyltransferase family protein [Polyangiales bacterium]
MKLAVVVQARMHSTRLPGKVMLPLGGKPLLERVLQRVRAAGRVQRLLVATTTSATDDPIVELCIKLGVDYVRGDVEDCLARHLIAAAHSSADAVATIRSNCPLIDPQVIDHVLSVWHGSEGRYDYLGNLRPPSWPDGNNVEIVSLAALRTAGREASEPSDREQTTSFLCSRPDRFRLGNVVWETGLDYSKSRRFVVDWPEDYAFVCAVFERLMRTHGPCFGVQAILRLLEREPELLAINAGRRGHERTEQNETRLREQPEPSWRALHARR